MNKDLMSNNNILCSFENFCCFNLSMNWLYVLVMSRMRLARTRRKFWRLSDCNWTCHVTYAFQSESTLYSFPNVRKLLARSRRKIWSLSDCNLNRNQNHLLSKWTLNHLAKLAKWLSCVVSTYLYGAFDCIFFPYHVRVSEWIHFL